MGVWEIVLIGIALSMDAFAVGMTNGMEEPEMRPLKALCAAGVYALFQFLMPVAGYLLGSAFASAVERIAPWLSFVLLGAIGAKMILDAFTEGAKGPRPFRVRKKLGAGKLLAQGVATSIDALAVGVTLLGAEASEGLPFHFALCAAIIGMITLSLSAAAIVLGKKIGNRLSEGAELLGGVILIAIGLKLLLEGVL